MLKRIFYVVAILSSTVIPVLAEVPACNLPDVQKPPSAMPFSISGDVSKPFTMNAEDAGRFTAVKVRLNQPWERGQIEGTFEGVSLVDLLQAADPITPADKAGLLNSTVSAQAIDGYMVAVSYSEADPKLVQIPVMVAFSCNGRAITPTLIAPGDLSSTRYVHELSAITLKAPQQ